MSVSRNATIVIWLSILIAGLSIIQYTLVEDDEAPNAYQEQISFIDRSNYAKTIKWRLAGKSHPLKLDQNSSQKAFNKIIEDTIYFAKQTKQYDRATELATQKLKDEFDNNKIEKWLFVVDDIKNNLKAPSDQMNSHRESFSIVSLHSVDQTPNEIINREINLMTPKLLRISSDLYYSKLYRELSLIRVGDLVEVSGNFRKSSELHFHSDGKSYGRNYVDYHKDMVFYIDIKSITPLLTKDELSLHSR